MQQLHRHSGKQASQLLLCAALVTVGCFRAPSLHAQGSAASVTLKRGATLAQAVEALAKATGGVIVADLGIEERRLEQPLEGVTVEQALRAVSTDFDRHWVRRGRTIALQLRRYDPDEPYGLEEEEARLVAAEMNRLLASLGVLSIHDRIRARPRFAASLTPGQIRQLAEPEGLPYGALSPEQQRLLRSLNLTHHFQGVVEDTASAARVVATLPQCTAIALPPPPKDDHGRERTRVLQIIAPRQAGQVGVTEIGILAPPLDVIAPDEARLQAPLPPTGIDVAVHGTFNAPRLRLGVQMLSLAQFSAEWKRAIGTPLRIPAFAVNRKFLICSAGASRVEAVHALADLWGWETSAIPKPGTGRRLGRPALATPKSIPELNAAMERAIPPAAWHNAAARSQRRDQRRLMREHLPLYQRLAKQPGIGRPTNVSSLPADDRRRMANAILDFAVSKWIRDRSSSGRAGLPVVPPHIANSNAIVIYGGPPDPKSPGVLRVTARVGAVSSGWSWPAFTVAPDAR